MFRQKELAELKLGIDTIPVERSAWEVDLPVSLPGIDL